MEQRLSATEARTHFGELLRRVSQNGETFVVERGGEPSAVVLPLAEYQRLRAPNGDSDGLEILHRARALRAQISKRRDGRPMPAPEEMLAEVRQLRAETLDDPL